MFEEVAPENLSTESQEASPDSTCIMHLQL